MLRTTEGKAWLLVFSETEEPHINQNCCGNIVQYLANCLTSLHLYSYLEIGNDVTYTLFFKILIICVLICLAIYKNLLSSRSKDAGLTQPINLSPRIEGTLTKKHHEEAGLVEHLGQARGCQHHQVAFLHDVQGLGHVDIDVLLDVILW